MRFAVKAAMVTAALAGPKWQVSLPRERQQWISARSSAAITRNLSGWR
jgi:hypothetical protein